MTISHERRKARIRKYRKSLFARKADCCARKCRQVVAVFRHIDSKTISLCAKDDERFRGMRRKKYGDRLLLESLR